MSYTVSIKDRAGAEALRRLRAKLAPNHRYKGNVLLLTTILRDYHAHGAVPTFPLTGRGLAVEAGRPFVSPLPREAWEYFAKIQAAHPLAYDKRQGHFTANIIRDALMLATNGDYVYTIIDRPVRGRGRFVVASAFDGAGYPPEPIQGEYTVTLRLEDETFRALCHIADTTNNTLAGAVELCLHAYTIRPALEPADPAGPEPWPRWLRHEAHQDRESISIPASTAQRLDEVILRRPIPALGKVEERQATNRVEALRECVEDWYRGEGLLGVYSHIWSLSHRGRWAQAAVTFNPEALP